MFDTQWGMPGQPWFQQGSFRDPAIPPLDDVDAGTLVQLPCVNKDWVKLITGSLQQLRNPTTWGDLADSDMATVLDRVDKLLQLVGDSPEAPCVLPVVNVAIDCVNGLQYQTSDGIWHVGTSMADICTCTTACIIAPAPANPQGVSNSQQACNLSGFLASEIIKVLFEKVVAYVGTMNQQVQFAKDVLQSIGFAFPITYAAANWAYDFYNDVVGQVLSDVESVRDDPVFWAEVTCAIYRGMLPDNHVTAANKPTIGTELAGLIYVGNPWAVVAVATVWNAFPLEDIQAMQNVGALDDVDCTNCGSGPWCVHFDFLTAAGPFVVVGGHGSWVSGSGWVGNAIGGTSSTNINIVAGPTSGSFTLDSVTITVDTLTNNTSGFPNIVAISTDGVHYTTVGTLSNTATGTPHATTFTFPPIVADYFGISVWADLAGGGYAAVTDLILKGPFGGTIAPTNCPP